MNTSVFNIEKIYSYHSYEQLFLGSVSTNKTKIVDRKVVSSLESELNKLAGKGKDNKVSYVFQVDSDIYIASFWDLDCRLVKIDINEFRKFPGNYDFIRKPHFQAASLKDLGLE